MVPDKARQKARQASLLDAPEEKPDSTDSLVARAFDSDPKVRLKVAQELGSIDDPRAIFALIELSSDKEEPVKEAAQRSLGNFKEESAEIVSLEKLMAERKVVHQQPVAPAPAASYGTSQRMAPTIERLFAHYEPKKRESVKRRLFPSLQKLFGFSKQELDPLQDIEKIAHAPTPASQVVEVMGKEDIPSENAPNFPFGQKKEAAPKPSDLVEMDEADAEMVSQPVSHEEEREASEEETEEEAPQNKYFALAYRLASTPGMGKTELKAEQNRLISNFKKEVEIAFKVAFARAKEGGFASL